jgi:carbamoyl-phosphate synthase large subunit
MKKLLVIGAGNYQVPAIKRIRDLGYEAYCVDYKENQPGFKYANGYKVIDVRDKDKCLEYSKELNVDGIVTWGSTLTLPTVSYICSKLHFPSLPLDVCELSTNKYQIRDKLTKAGCNSAGECIEFHSVSEANGHHLVAPFVIKPSDGSGSKGVKIVLSDDGIKEAIDYAFGGARDNHVYVEPFIPGKEFSVEAFVCNGEIHVNTIISTDFKWEGNYPIYKQTTYQGLTESLESAIEIEVIKSIKALNITSGPVNFDVIISDIDHKPYIIDVGIRNGQNLIASHIIPYSRGIDELDCSIALALGDAPDAQPKYKKIISSRLLIYDPGRIEEIKFDELKKLIGERNIVDIILRKNVGEILPPYKTKSDICGWVLCEGKNPEEASSAADNAWELMKQYIIIK